MEKKELNYWPGTQEITKPAKAVARLLGVNRKTLFRWVKAGKIECIKYGCNSMHFTYDQVREHVNRSREKVTINW